MFNIVCDSHSGWGKLKQEGFTLLNFSYLRDTGKEFLDAAIFSLEYDVPFVLQLNGEEDGDYILVANDDEVCLLYDTNFKKDVVAFSDEDKYTLIRSCISDIDIYEASWVLFKPDIETADEVRGRALSFDRKIEYIKKLLKKY